MTLYLNNDGSRWIETRNGKRHMPFVLVMPDGVQKVRSADWYESFGNFAATVFRYKGKRYRALPKGADGSSFRTTPDELPHIFFKDLQ